VKAAVVGAGPAGLAAAGFLLREGFEVHLFERETEPGGIVRWVLPGFRLPAAAVQKDVSLLRDLGAQFHFGAAAPGARDLQAQGFRHVLLGVGAEADRDIGIPGAREVLGFLREFRLNPSRPRPGRSVAVVGAGDTAMDAARAALRCRGVREVRIVYRRAEEAMPASREEYESAKAEGVAFHFMRAPLRWSRETSALVCQVMEAGPADASGRASPVPTAATETLPADSVITAAGADIDGKALAALGLADGRADPATQETGVPGVYLVGDAAEGAATIVRGIASARRAADAICAKEGGTRADRWPLPPEDTAALRASRDRLIPVTTETGRGRTASIEAGRCLGCRALCVKCVEVCPNRANTLVTVPGLRDEAQIVHIDAFCNECGNCATFCPWEGRPYRDKLTVYATEEDFLDSGNPGIFVGSGTRLVRLQGQVSSFTLDAAGSVTAGISEEPVKAVVRAIVRDHPYLLGGTR
jgi:putative selenate reductase